MRSIYIYIYIYDISSLRVNLQPLLSETSHLANYFPSTIYHLFHAFLHIYFMLYFYFIGLQVSFWLVTRFTGIYKKSSTIRGENTLTVSRAFTAASPESHAVRGTVVWQKQLQ